MPLDYEPWEEVAQDPEDRRSRVLRLLLLAALMRLVYGTARQDVVDAEEWYARLLRITRDAYDQELTVQAAHVGCPDRMGHLTNAAILETLRERCRLWAGSIVNTYNYYLAAAIIHVHGELPDASRAVYAERLAAWEEHYWSWKLPQIYEFTANWARARAQQDFYQQNTFIHGTAVMEPERAVCPVCQGWVARGEVPLRVAMNNPPPYHPNCPHYWYTMPDKVHPDVCPQLWMGE